MDMDSLSQTLGNFGEFIGAIAVVVTLVYLARQIKSSGEATRALVRQSVSDTSVASFAMSISPDRVMEAKALQRKGETLNPDDEAILMEVEFVHFRVFEGCYSNYERGFLDESDWYSYRETIRGILRTNSLACKMWRGNPYGWLPGFKLVVDQIYEQVSQDGQDQRSSRP